MNPDAADKVGLESLERIQETGVVDLAGRHSFRGNDDRLDFGHPGALQNAGLGAVGRHADDLGVGVAGVTGVVEGLKIGPFSGG